MKKLAFLFLLLLANVALFSQVEEEEEGVDEIFTTVQEMPIFPTCKNGETLEETKKCSEKELLKYIYKNIKYPKQALESGIEGTVIAQFIVTKTGKINSIRIAKNIGAGCDEELTRVLESINTNLENWKPGKQNGRSVAVMYNLPVRFKLPEGSDEDLIFTVVENMPAFGDCAEETTNKTRKRCTEKSTIQYVEDNMIYPIEALYNGVEGIVVVRFVVTKTGEIKDIEVVKGIGKGCANEVVRVVKTMEGKWKNGTQRGKAVHVRYNLAIRFKMTKEIQKARKAELKAYKKNKN